MDAHPTQRSWRSGLLSLCRTMDSVQDRYALLPIWAVIWNPETQTAITCDEYLTPLTLEPSTSARDNNDENQGVQ